MAHRALPPAPPLTAANGVGGDSLLQEAQEEISALRSELYATRRTGWAAQQALLKVHPLLPSLSTSVSDALSPLCAFRVLQLRAPQPINVPNAP